MNKDNDLYFYLSRDEEGEGELTERDKKTYNALVRYLIKHRNWYFGNTILGNKNGTTRRVKVRRSHSKCDIDLLYLSCEIWQIELERVLQKGFLSPSTVKARLQEVCASIADTAAKRTGYRVLFYEFNFTNGLLIGLSRIGLNHKLIGRSGFPNAGLRLLSPFYLTLWNYDQQDALPLLNKRRKRCSVLGWKRANAFKHFVNFNKDDAALTLLLDQKLASAFPTLTKSVEKMKVTAREHFLQRIKTRERSALRAHNLYRVRICSLKRDFLKNKR
jgi:hypothetical protein